MAEKTDIIIGIKKSILFFTAGDVWCHSKGQGAEFWFCSWYHNVPPLARWYGLRLLLCLLHPSAQRGKWRMSVTHCCCCCTNEPLYVKYFTWACVCVCVCRYFDQVCCGSWGTWTIQTSTQSKKWFTCPSTDTCGGSYSQWSVLFYRCLFKYSWWRE